MCGILGQISIDSQIKINKPLFKEALDLMIHRGPDDSGILMDDKFIFGHRRLSIIDLSSSAKQPMVSGCGNIIINFNGEIYNFKELRIKLREKGYIFKTNSDTEVLLNGYLCDGIDFINKCIGMFAFALFDKRFNKSYLIRDRLGIKPLYYCIHRGRITFASEIKSIIAYEDIEKELNLDAVSAYLSFRYPILNDTFFKNIVAIPPASYIEIEGDTIKTVNYWNPINEISEQKTDKGEEWYISELSRLLKSSTIYRKISDVPVGVLLKWTPCQGQFFS